MSVGGGTFQTVSLGDWDEGWCAAAQRIDSPNFDDRPEGEAISLIVVHAISLPPAQFGSDDISRLFTNTLDPQAHPYFSAIAAVQVSAHFLIRRDGALLQFVSCRQRAWHAGVSSFAGRDNCNDFSLGIELEGTDDLPYSEAQYDALVPLVQQLLAAYPALSVERICGHSDIAPGRKTDPGPAFAWPRLRTALLAGPVAVASPIKE